MQSFLFALCLKHLCFFCWLGFDRSRTFFYFALFHANKVVYLLSFFFASFRPAIPFFCRRCFFPISPYCAASRGNRGGFAVLLITPKKPALQVSRSLAGRPRALALAPWIYTSKGFIFWPSLSTCQRTAFFQRPKRWAVSVFQFAWLQIKLEPVSDRRRPALSQD